MRVAVALAAIMASSLLAKAAAATPQPASQPMQFPAGLTAADILPAGFNAKDYATAGIWDRTWQALEKVLGGNEPTYIVAQTIGSQNANGRAHPDSNSVEISALVQAALLDQASPQHSGALNVLPHELMHLRQTPAVLASLADSEGGAQAFADKVSPTVARQVHTYYDASRNYDGVYADYVKQAQARGNDWIFGSQMGKAPVPFPR